MAERHKIKKGCCAPQPRPGNLQQENQIRMRLLTGGGIWRGLGGFGHLAQYNAIQAGPGYVNWHDVMMNRFARFKFFAEQVGDKEADGQLTKRADAR